MFQEITDVLEPARVATEELSVSSINLLVGEGVLKFLLSKSREAQTRHNSYLNENFITALEKRFEDRRDAVVNTLIMYLSNHGSFKCGIETMIRLFKNNENPSTNLQPPNQEAHTSTSIQDRLKMFIGSVREGNQEAPNGDNFKKLFDQYDRHHVRDPQLDQLFDALCSIHPTST